MNSEERSKDFLFRSLPTGHSKSSLYPSGRQILPNLSRGCCSVAAAIFLPATILPWDKFRGLGLVSDRRVTEDFLDRSAEAG
jgi:hypothetical protein